jgi:hypothetical protein
MACGLYLRPSIRHHLRLSPPMLPIVVGDIVRAFQALSPKYRAMIVPLE